MKTTRIEGLAAWRAILMLGGLVLHATMGLERHAPVTVVNIVSGSFRMGAFFTLSGLLTGMTMARHGAQWGEWIGRRMVALSLPTLFGLTVICPIVRLQLAILDGGHLPTLNVYHLWFMVALLDYTMLAWLLWRIDRAGGLLARIEARALPPWLGQPLLLVATGTAVFMPMVSTSAVVGQWSGEEAALFRQVPLIAGYAPLYLVGLLCGRLPMLCERLLASPRAPVAILAIAAAAHVAARTGWLPVAGEGAEPLLLMAGAAWCPLPATVLILRSARRIRRVPPLLQTLSDASLTMYLAHYPLILAIRILIAPLDLHPVAAFVAMLVGGGTLSYLVHARMVRRSHWLAILLNGRVRPVSA